MKTHQCILMLLLTLCFGTQKVTAQLVIDNAGTNNNPAALVNGVLVGNGIQTSNISFTGDATQQIGYFSNGVSSVGMQSGLLLSTGSVHVAAGPNDETSATLPAMGIQNSNDPDLVTIAGGGILFDAAVLEFDFEPVGNEVVLRYVFASEEYNENVCSDLADVFGIFVSGPGIAGPFTNGAVNYALLPNTAIPVGINTVNNGQIGANGFPTGCGGAGDPGLSHSPYFLANPSDSMQYDGSTIVMEARFTVECNETYPVKIAIGDVDNVNGLGDSGLFLQASSFFSSGVAVYQGENMDDTTLVEGCVPGFIFLTRQDSVGDETFQVAVGGTATNGADYPYIANNITIPDGQDGVHLSIAAIADGIAEGQETIDITITFITECGDTFDRLWHFTILDEYLIDLEVTSTDTITCAGEQITVEGIGTGGSLDYTFSWSNTSTNTIFNDSPTEPTMYVLWLHDRAGCTATDSVYVLVHPMPYVNAGPDTALCDARDHELGQYINGFDGATYLWAPSYDLSSTNVPYPMVNITQDRIYTVTVTTLYGCVDTDQITVIHMESPTADAGGDKGILYQQNEAVLDGDGNGTPWWGPNTALSCEGCFDPIATPEETTTYTFTSFGANGCVTTDEMIVSVYVPELIFVPNAFSPNGDGSNDIFRPRGYTLENMEFWVYDRWGEEVFHSNDKNFGWDGTVNGQAAVSGNYMYMLKGVYITGKVVTQQGDVALIR
jgi:gliding motility-associated-like protein